MPRESPGKVREQILLFLLGSPEPETKYSIMMGLNPAGASSTSIDRNVELLVAEGLVAEQPGTTHREAQSYFYYLTPAGRVAAERLPGSS